MKCENCGLELEEGVTACPHCQPEENAAVCPQCDGEEAACKVEKTGEEAVEATEEAAEEAVQETPAKKEKPPVWKLLVSAVSLIVLAAVLCCGLLYGMGYRWHDFFPENDIHYKESYTADAATLDKLGDKTVATVGDVKLTGKAFQYCYWTQVYSFLNQYAYYLTDIDLDLYTPLSQQTCYFDDALTWEQYFIMCALDNWTYYATMNMLSQEAADFAVSEDLRLEMENLPQDLQAQAEEAGFEDYGALMAQQMGSGATLDGAVEYLRNFYLGDAYFAHLYELYAPDEGQMEAYYTEHEAQYVEDGTSKEDGYTVDVRHILIQPTDGTLNEDGYTYTYTDEKWEEALAEAEKVYNEWLAGEATEDSFAEAAKNHSSDGSASYGGLYTGVTTGQMVTEFNDWCFDEARQVGDHGIVKTVYGYHIMYFSGSQLLWTTAVDADYRAEHSAEVLKQGMDRWPAKINYKNIALGEVAFATE